MLRELSGCAKITTLALWLCLTVPGRPASWFCACRVTMPEDSRLREL